MFKKNVYERFHNKVDKTGPCWNWTARKDKDGYGEFQYEGKKERAHRVSFILHIGDLAPGEFVLHSCDNPACVKPAHLRVGTVLDNKRDSIERDRHPAKERHGMTKLTIEQVTAIKQDSRKQIEIAQAFGIGQSHVSRIKRGESWTT